MNRLEKRVQTRKKISRIEAQIDALLKSQRHFEYSASVDSEYSVLDDLCGELIKARRDLERLCNSPGMSVKLPTYISMELSPTVGDHV
jgi:hypothetical protein